MLYAPEKTTIPTKVYRYTSWNNHTEDILENNRLFMAPIEKLNDKFEFRIDIAKLCDSIEADGQIVGKIKITEEEKDITRKYKGNSKKYQEMQGKGIRNTRRMTRIACFTDDNNNTMMWNHYANEYKGICLEWTNLFKDIESSEDIFGKVIYGTYEDAVKTVMKSRAYFLDTSGQEIMYKEIFPTGIKVTAPDTGVRYFFKSDYWSKEHEYRLVRFLKKRSSFDEYYNFDCTKLTGIYCGIDMEEKTKRKIYEFAHDVNINVKIYKATYKQAGWGFDFLPYTPQC